MQAVADTVRTAYATLKRKRVEEVILAPMLGTDFQGFQGLIGGAAASQLLAQVLGMVMQHNLNLDLLVAGLDATGAQLYAVGHPGQVIPMNSTGFSAVGSGGLHAAVRMSLGQHTPTASLVDTVYNVYEAKRAAEVAPGVGNLTDMSILKDGKTTQVSPELFKVLEEVHKERPVPSAAETAKIKDACDACFN